MMTGTISGSIGNATTYPTRVVACRVGMVSRFLRVRRRWRPDLRRLGSLAAAGAAACLALGCQSRDQEWTLRDLSQATRFNDDTRAISGALGSGAHYVEGFYAPGDSGRAMKGGMAALRFNAVSDRARSLVLEASVPRSGGELLAAGPRGDVILHGAFRNGGPGLVSGNLPTGSVAPGVNRLTLLWRSGAPGSGEKLAVRGAWINPSTDGALSYATYDPVGDVLHLGPGASAEVFIVPGRDARVHFKVGGQGTATITMDRGVRPFERIWSQLITGEPQGYVVPLPSVPATGLVGLALKSGESGATSWHGVRFRDFSVPEWMRGEDPGGVAVLPDSVMTWNVLLYLVDTVRRDHLQIYGYAKHTTPHLAAQISDWVVWDDCQSLSSWTRPSTATVLTGLDPILHGAVTEANSLRPGVEPVWAALRSRGWETAYLTTNSHVIQKWGFGIEVDFYRHFKESKRRRTAHLAADSLHTVFLDWLDHRDVHDRPFFAYLHASDPHSPYTPPPEFIPRFYPPGCPQRDAVLAEDLKRMVCPGIVEPWERDAAEALYDAEIAAWDQSFARLLQDLSRRGFLENTVIILTSDHGEEFGDHGSFSHGLTLYREQLEVPFLARVPGRPGGRSRLPVDHRDIDDLLMAVIGGRDPLAWTPPRHRSRLAHLSLRNIEMARIQTDRLSLVWNVCPVGACGAPTPDFELFMDDPAETLDVAERWPLLCRSGSAILDAWIRSAQPSVPISLDKGTMEQLRLLGYVTDE